jgi:hypothetical protein
MIDFVVVTISLPLDTDSADEAQSAAAFHPNWPVAPFALPLSHVNRGRPPDL